MPKETVYVYGDNPQDVTRVSVHWGRGSFAQIGVERSSAGATELDPGNYSWTEKLSRDHINHLIRVLRKARDQVHGRDE